MPAFRKIFTPAPSVFQGSHPRREFEPFISRSSVCLSVSEFLTQIQLLEKSGSESRTPVEIFKPMSNQHARKCSHKLPLDTSVSAVTLWLEHSRSQQSFYDVILRALAEMSSLYKCPKKKEKKTIKLYNIPPA